MIEASNLRPNRRLSQNEFLMRLRDNNIKYKPLDKYVRMYDKLKWQCDKYNNHIWEARPHDILNGNGCPYCSNHKILAGFNDLWTTNPKVANLLVDKNVGYVISEFSHLKYDFECPNCHKIIKNKSVYKVSTCGLQCPNCSDGISYPEKFMSNMLSQLNIEYCHDCSLEWSDIKRYDFYIKSMSIIIECHGEQHYSNKTRWINNVEKQIDNDNYKKNLAMSNGIKHYIELDCRQSSCDYIKKSIVNSELNELFNLSIIDWEKCDLESQNSNVIKVVNLWNNGIKSVSDISNVMKLHRQTITRYLKRMAKLGLCDYDGKEQMRLSAAKNREYKNRVKN